jgi:hypothetical protein
MTILLALALSAACSLLAARLGVARPLSRRIEALTLLTGALVGAAFGLVVPGPALAAAAAITGGLLVGSCVADLRERMVHVGVLAVGTGIVVVLLALGWADLRPPLGWNDLLPPLVGLVFGLLMGGLIFGGGWLFSHFRHGIDPETGEPSEDYGFGDVVIWSLVGTLLVSLPPYGSESVMRFAVAFLGAHILVGLLSLAVLIARPLHLKLGNTVYLPLVPAITVVTLGVILIGVHA